MADSGYCSNSVDGAVLPPNFCSHEVSSRVGGLSQARGLFVTEEDYLLVLERGVQRVMLMLFNEVDSTGKKSLFASDSIPLVSATGLNHGLAIDTEQEYIYATSADQMFRWPRQVIQETVTAYELNPSSSSTQLELNNQQRELVMDNLSLGRAGGNHITRTVAFDPNNLVYISVGSSDNVDSDSSRARIHRFNISSYDPSEFPIDFSEGEVFADGVRNEVGVEFDVNGVLWGVENGPDNLGRPDLPSNINEDNPAEELNRFLEPDTIGHNFYGYPYCWTEYNLTDEGLGRGTPWAWGSFMPEYDDNFCRDTNNVIRPPLSMQAHSAPLGLAFLKQSRTAECVGGFPPQLQSDLFVGFHGSWNRDVPTGHKVVYVPFSNGMPTGEVSNLFCSSGETAPFDSGLRPVDVVFDSCGRMIVSSDGTGGRGSQVFMITYHGNGSEFEDGSFTSISCQEDDESTLLAAALTGILFFFLILGLVVLYTNKSSFSSEPRPTKTVKEEKSNIT